MQPIKITLAVKLATTLHLSQTVNHLYFHNRFSKACTGRPASFADVRESGFVAKTTKERAKKQIVARNRKVSTPSKKQENAATKDHRTVTSNANKPAAAPVAGAAADKKKRVAPTASKHAAQGENHANRRGASAADAAGEIPLDRRTKRDRRYGEDRRKEAIPVAVERRKLERRVKVNRRRQIDPTTCERDYSSEEVEFMAAVDAYKHSSGRMFPTCSEVLEVLRGLGYQKRATEPVDPSSGPIVDTPKAATALADIEPPIAMPVGA
jgi:hypothetical protein